MPVSFLRLLVSKRCPDIPPRGFYVKDMRHVMCTDFLPKKVKNQSISLLFFPGVLPTPSLGGKTTLPPPSLSLTGGLVDGNWRSQTSSLEVQQSGRDFCCPRDSLSILTHSYLTFSSQWSEKESFGGSGGTSLPGSSYSWYS